MAHTERRNKYGILIFGALFVLAADQATKIAVFAHLQSKQSVTLIENLLSLSLVGNDGAVFGLFSGQKVPFFLILSGLALGLLIYLFSTLKMDKASGAIAPALILGGALGNQIDRVRLGFVVDFIHVHHRFSMVPFDFNWFKFNVADAAILIGVGLFSYTMIRLEKERMQKQEKPA